MLTTSPVAIPSPVPGVRREGDDGLAGGDGRPHGELELFLLVQLVDRVEDAESRADGALGVVLVRDRRAEDRHHRVADELLDRAAEALDLPRRRARGTGAASRGRPRDRRRRRRR